MTASARTLILTLSPLTLPVMSSAQGTDTATQNDSITTQTESDGASGNEVQGPESTDTTTDTATDTATDAATTNDPATGTAGTENDAVTTSSESDGVAGNERQGPGFPWGLLGLLGLAGLAGRGVVEQRREVKLGGPTDGPRPS